MNSIITDDLCTMINDLFDECLNIQKPFHRKVDLFIIPETLATRILKSTNINVFNHTVCMDNYGIIHTLEEHGNPISEAKRGQIAIVKEDFITMVDVFLNPDEIVEVGVTKHTQKPLLQFIRKIDEKIYVVQEVRTITSQKKHKVSRLVFHTMYKIKATKNS